MQSRALMPAVGRAASDEDIGERAALDVVAGRALKEVCIPLMFRPQFRSLPAQR
jgi:hypothetical protein